MFLAAVVLAAGASPGRADDIATVVIPQPQIMAEDDELAFAGRGAD